MEPHFKTCSKCKETKLRKKFSKDRKAKDGLKYQCKACMKRYLKQYYQENREQKSKYDKQRYQENREQNLEYAKRWGKNNPEKRAAKRAKYRASKRDGIPDVLRDCPIEKSRLEQIYKLRGLLTEATGVQYHVDHIWPLSKGGPHWSGNLQIITAEENLSKKDALCEYTVRVIEESLDEHISSRQ